MAVVGAEVTGAWFLSSGVVSFFILLLLLSIFLTALCSDCRRRSFELREPEVDRYPSSLIRVVRLEEVTEARENPMINEIQNDEKVINPVEENTVSFTPWRSHLAAPQSHQDAQTNGIATVTTTTTEPETTADNAIPVTPWRSHLGAPQSQDSNHIYHVIGGGRRSSGGGNSDVSSSLANQEPGEEGSGLSVRGLSDRDRNSVYAQISKKVRPTTPPGGHTPEQEEEETSPPLPDRRTQLDQ